MSAITDISDVLNKLPKGNNDALTLQPSNFSNPQVQVFFANALDGNALVINHAVISPVAAGSITVTGQGSVLGFDGLATQLTFHLPDGSDQLDIRLRGNFDPQKAISLPLIQWLALHNLAIETEVQDEFGGVTTRLYGSLKLEGVDDIPIILSRTGQSEWSLNIGQDKPVPLPDLNHLAQLVGGESLASFFPQSLVDAIAGISLGGIACQFNTQTKSLSYFTITITVTNGWKIVSGLELLPGMTLTLAITNPAGGQKTLFGALRATSMIGSQKVPLYVQGSAGGSTQWMVAVSPDDKIVLPTLNEILKFAGGQDFVSSLPSGFSDIPAIAVRQLIIQFDPVQRAISLIRFAIGTAQPWNVIDGYFSIKNVSMEMSILDITDSTRRSILGRLIGSFKIGPAFLQFMLRRDNPADAWSLTGSLPAGQSVNLTQVATSLFSGLATLPSNLPEIVFDQLSVTVTPANGSLAFHAASTSTWNFVPGTFEINNFSLDFAYSKNAQPSKFQGALATKMTLGGVLLNFSAQLNQSSGAGLVFSGTAGPGSIPLGQFVQQAAHQIGASLPQSLVQAIQDIQIENLEVSFDTQKKSFQFIGNAKIKGVIPLGAKSYELQTRAKLFSAVDQATGQRSFTGNLEADLQIGKAMFVVSFDFGPNAKIFKGQWRTTDGTAIGFEDIAEALGIPHTISVPQGLDLGLKSAAFEYHSADNMFMLSAESSLFGDAFFTGGKGQSGSWGFIFGVNLPPRAKLSSLPVIGKDLKAADFLTFKQSAVMLSSTTFKNVVLPGLPALPPAQPAVSTQLVAPSASGRNVKPVAGGATLQLTPGLSLAASLDFSASSSDRKTHNLLSIVGGDELLLQVSIGQSGLSLYASLSGKVGIPSGKTRLALTSPAIRIDLTTEVVFQLSGGMSFVINGAQIVATARLIISETEAQVAVDISSDHGSLPSPPGVKGLHIQNFGMIMGVFFEPPGLDLGLQGKFRIGQVQGTRDDEFAIVLEVIEELPNILYLSFYVDKLDLGQVITLFTDKTEPAIVQAMEIVKASDLSFHWSEGVVVLPDGSIGQPGFGFSGSIQIFDFGAHADLEVGVTTGIHGDAEMSPVNLKGVLEISGDGKGISRTYQQLNGQWTLVANNSIVRQKPVPPTRQEVIVPPGGPVIQFNSSSSPFVHVNWLVTLFDVVKTRTEVTISSSGFAFLLTYDVVGIEHFSLNCTLKDRDHFSASAIFHLGVDERVGPIRVAGIDCGSLHLVVRIDAGMSITLDPTLFAMGINGSFNFEGLAFSIPTVNVSVAPSSLKELPAKIAQQIKDHADQLFAALFADAKKWAEMIGRGVVVGVTDMSNALKNAYHKTAQEAAQLMKAANQAANTVAAGLKTTYGLTADAAASAMKGAGYAADQVAAGLKQGYNLTAQAATNVLRGAGYAANEVGNALKSAYGQTAQQAAQLLHQAGYAADQVGNALRFAFGQSAQQAAQILKGAGYAADQVGNAMKTAFGVTANQAAQILKGVGFDVNQIGNTLRSVFGAPANTVASALKGAGFAVDQVGNFVKNSFNLGPGDLNNVLQGVGFAADQVKGFFNSLGGAFAQTFSEAAKKLDPRNW